MPPEDALLEAHDELMEDMPAPILLALNSAQLQVDYETYNHNPASLMSLQAAALQGQILQSLQQAAMAATQPQVPPVTPTHPQPQPPSLQGTPSAVDSTQHSYTSMASTLTLTPQTPKAATGTTYQQGSPQELLLSKAVRFPHHSDNSWIWILCVLSFCLASIKQQLTFAGTRSVCCSVWELTLGRPLGLFSSGDNNHNLRELLRRHKASTYGVTTAQSWA